MKEIKQYIYSKLYNHKKIMNMNTKEIKLYMLDINEYIIKSDYYYVFKKYKIVDFLNNCFRRKITEKYKLYLLIGQLIEKIENIGKSIEWEQKPKNF